MNWFVLLLQFVFGRLPATAPVRAVRRIRGRRVAFLAGELLDSPGLGSFCLRPLQSVELSSYVLARLLPGPAPAQQLRAERRRNQRPVYEPGCPADAPASGRA